MPSRATPALLISTSTWSHVSITASTNAFASSDRDRSAVAKKKWSGCSVRHRSTSGVTERAHAATRSPEAR